MTSTVLDVTVLLLCVSASVVALGAAGGDRGTTGAEAAEVADLIATETVPVTYASTEAPNGTRTVHATRAELLALLVDESDEDGREGAAREAFESEALSAIDRGVGPRTRIDAAVETKGSGGSGDGVGTESGDPSPDAAAGSPFRASNASEAPTGPGGWQFGSDGIDRAPAETTGAGVPWRIDRGEGGDRGSEAESPATGSEPAEAVTVGSEPPRGADVTVAMITHPVPNDSDGTETVRIVIRRW